ncbi:MAG: MFS transporter, partial [Candidatus Thorarchaeota archaeon]
MKRSKYFELFGDKNFLFLWIGTLGFGLGGAIFSISLNWWVLIETNSEVQLGIVNTLIFLPMLILCFFSGLLTDMFNRLNLMVFSLMLRGIIILIFPILQILRIIELWHIYILSFLQGISFPFFLNSINAIMPEIIKRENLYPANALIDSAMWFSNVVGYLSGGFLINTLGYISLFTISAYTLIIGSLMFFPIKYTYRNKIENISLRRILSDIKKGLVIMKNDSVLLMLTITWTIIMMLFSNGPISIGLPVFSERILNAGSEGYGILVTAVSASSLIGSLMIGHWGSKIKKGRLTLIGYIWGAIGILIFTFTTNIVFSASILFFWSFYFPLINIPYWTAMQERIPHEELGKITGVSFTLNSVVVPISTMMTGYVMEFISITLPFILFSTSFILCFFIIYLH